MINTGIQSLLTRRSVKFVQQPGPSDDELDQILRAAMCAPDHGRLRPWRFSLIRGDAILELAEFATAESRKAGIEISKAKEATTRKWLEQVPLLIAVACYIDPENTRIPEIERVLATGASVINILNASHMLGYAAYWSTGLGTYVPSVNEALGYPAPDYRFMGYVSIGTPLRDAPDLPRPDYNDFISNWTGLPR